MDASSIEIVEEFIIKKSSVITPNYYELMMLTGNSVDDPIKAGEILLKKYKKLKAVVVKGGHIDEDKEEIVDTLVYNNNKNIEKLSFLHKRIQSKNTHGTGCTFSSAITAYLAKNYDIINAVRLAVDFTAKLISASRELEIGRGNGPLPHHILSGVN